MMSTAFDANQRFRDFQRLLAVVRLRYQEIVHVHAQLARVDGIEGVLGVNERRLAAQLLRLRRSRAASSVVLPADSGP